MTYRFDAGTELTQGPAGLRVQLDAGWNIGAVPNGGYQLAACCRAATAALGAPDVLNATAYFLAPAAPGEATLAVEPVKRGRGTSLAEVQLHQAGKERLRSLILAGDLTQARGPELHRTAPPPLPPPDACPRVSPSLMPAPQVMDEIEFRLDPDTAAFLRGETNGVPELRAWMRFADGRPTDALSLIFFADAFPPTIFNALGLTPWVPTLELTVQVRRRPDPGWLRLVAITRHVSAGHFEEDVELWDARGELVALARQRALLLQR